MKKYLREKEGGALVIVLMVLLIMTILGTTLLGISLAENKQAIRENNRIEAYYLAKSGVETTAAWILKPGTTQQQIDQIVNKKSQDNSYGSGTFNVEVLKDAVKDDLVIVGTGVVNGVTSRTRMIIEKSNDPSDDLKFDYAIYLKSNADFRGSIVISGDLGYPEGVIVTIGGNAEVIGDRVPINIDYPTPKIPEADLIMSALTSSTLTFEEDVSTIRIDNDITVGANEDLTIDTGTGSGEVNLVINGKFTFGNNQKSELRVTGDKRVNIYLKEAADINGNINKDGAPQNVLFIMDDTGIFNLRTNVYFNAFIYAPFATFKTSGNTNMTGAIIVNKADLGGTPFLDGYVFDPNLDSIEIPLTRIYSKGTWLD